jgi:hypothetical protein
LGFRPEGDFCKVPDAIAGKRKESRMTGRAIIYLKARGLMAPRNRPAYDCMQAVGTWGFFAVGLQQNKVLRGIAEGAIFSNASIEVESNKSAT